MTLYLGLLSGTSMDGIDCALVDMPSHRLVAAQTVPWPSGVRQLLTALCEPAPVTVPMFARAHVLAGRAFGEAALSLMEKAGVRAEDVNAIGSHGQTVYHDAFSDVPVTVQLGCAHSIAEITGVRVVTDFRTRDMVAGGQGAPLAPVFHQAVFGDADVDVAVANIGGIANITVIAPGKPCIGYDTGPGNALMDAWCLRHLGKPYDAKGAWASEGRVIPALLESLMGDAWFRRPAPRSVDKGYFSLAWLEQHMRDDQAPADIQATLLEFTAATLANALSITAPGARAVFICGGGAHNASLMAALARRLPDTSVQTTLAKGIHPDYVEAMLFAWLAQKTVTGTPLDLGSITGSKHPVLLGVVYPVPGVIECG